MRKTVYVCDQCGVEVSEQKIVGWISIYSNSDINMQISIPNTVSTLGLGSRFISLDNKEFCSGLCLSIFFKNKINGYPV